MSGLRPGVVCYLSEQQKKAGQSPLAQEWAEIEELYNKKLWHQLTLRVIELTKNPALHVNDGLIKLYHGFVIEFEHKINPLALMQIVAAVAKQIKDPRESFDYLTRTKEKISHNVEAHILCFTCQGQIRLAQKDLASLKVILSEAETLLNGMDGVTAVHSYFYELSSNYHYQLGNHASYYRDALRYLGCTNIQDIPVEEHKERAFNLSLAAILGQGIYNFGELLAHPILDSLNGTEHSWLVELLYAFNSGSLAKFETLRPQWEKQMDLAPQEVQMKEKIRILCLMEMTFKRPATKRQLTFDEIAAEAQISRTEVELLLMKTLSLGLVRGSIDQVDGKVHMTWVQPRVLDRDQISAMRRKLEMWRVDVESMENLVETKAQTIIT